jgi:Putative sensor
MTHIDLTPIADTVPQHVDRVTMPHGDAEPRNTRFSAWTRSALRDMVYCGAVFAWSIAAFTILVAGIAATASLLFLLVSVFAWIGFAHVLRWTTWVNRKLAGWQRHEQVPAGRLSPTSHARIHALLEDGQLGPADLEGYGLARRYIDRRLCRWACRDHGLGSGCGLRIHAALVLGGLASPDGVRSH